MPVVALDSYEVFNDIGEIPGVSKSDIDAIEKLKEDNDKLVYGWLESSDAFLDADGNVSGFASYYCKWLSTLFGIEIEPRVYKWNDLLSGLEDGSINLSSYEFSDSGKFKSFKSTTDIAERAAKAFRLSNAEPLDEISKQRAINVGSLRDSQVIAKIGISLHLPYVLIEYDDYESVKSALVDGSIDVFYDAASAEAAFEDSIIVSADYLPIVLMPVVTVSVDDRYAVIPDVVQKAMNSGANIHLQELYNLGLQNYKSHRFSIALTPEEALYIESHLSIGMPIEIAVENNNYPISFYNDKEKDYQGISIDTLKEIAKITGLQFQIVDEENGVWSKIRNQLAEHDIAMVDELIKTKSREGRYLWTEHPYSLDYYALISTVEYENVTLDTIPECRVGLEQDSGKSEFFLTWYPDQQNTVLYSDINAAFDALKKGEIDLFMGSRNLVLYRTNYQEDPGFKVNYSFNVEFGSYFGFNRDEEILCSIVSKAQDLVDTEEISDRWTKKVFDYRGKVAKTQITFLIIGSVLLLIILILAIMLLLKNSRMNTKLEQTVKVRTAELEIQTDAAEIASMAKSDFLARMSHEIRTPLNAIIGMATIAGNDAAGNEKVVNDVDEILKASDHLLGILNDVLDMAKIEAGKFILNAQPFAFKPAMMEVESIIQSRCAEKNIEFLVDLNVPSDVTIIGDKLRLKQVIINLLGNAVKFTDEGGEIGFSVFEESAKADEIVLRFTVFDNGIGITDEQKEKLFEAFEQADASISSRFGGTGLGLAISQNLVKNMGGNIGVESTPGMGSSFSFVIPFEVSDVPEENVRITSEVPKLSGKNILLVEDIQINRDILLSLLADTGASFECADDGKKGILLFEASEPFHFDLIFMDIQMPVMNGYEAATAIRALDREDAKTVPIIAMTANAYKEDVDKAIEAGMNGHIAKPIDLNHIYNALTIIE
jgi:signal transduction histidine kinase/CheY-like chemotaxis protein